ncbi:MAG: hypothetical protein MJ065_04240 [Oscillospiraceae bacterium]|nr:hypothetical protein [Oscillospiraceae bacterium]
MGLFDVFSKGGKYFGKAIEPKCEYCEFGNRSSDGNKVLCTKKGMVDAEFHCPKFQYSPLKRIPVKQMQRVGWLEGDYDEKEFSDDGKLAKDTAKNDAVPTASVVSAAPKAPAAPAAPSVSAAAQAAAGDLASLAAAAEAAGSYEPNAEQASDNSSALSDM